jgi:hypothetical protein
MITIFNRKELFLTPSLYKLRQIRNILEGNKIDYKLVMKNSSGVRTTHGAPTYLNYIYVHKDDYEKARVLIAPVLR